VKLTAQVKLVVTPEQADALKRTMQAANAVCDSLSAWAWENQTFQQYPLHKGQYAVQRADSGLTAQVVVRCIGKVADSYKLDKKIQRTFQPLGSIAFDDRILNWYVDREQVSIWTVDGRMKLAFECGEYQKGLLEFRQGESDLAFVNGNFYLMATVSIPDPPLIETDGFLGIDLGIVNIATDSLGNVYSGEEVRAKRSRDRKHRRGLQHQAMKHHSKSAYRRLCAKGRKLSRYTRWLNHNISRRIVECALASRKAIVLEDLKGIRDRASAYGREFRWQLGNWAFHQLAGFIRYKAQAAGIPVTICDPRNTSRTCPCCGFCDRLNRKSQSHFLCLECGYDANADYVGALNIAARGSVTCPMDGAKPIPA
jgi:IS605 OrfB family transposase